MIFCISASGSKFGKISEFISPGIEVSIKEDEALEESETFEIEEFTPVVLRASVMFVWSLLVYFGVVSCILIIGIIC